MKRIIEVAFVIMALFIIAKYGLFIIVLPIPIMAVFLFGMFVALLYVAKYGGKRTSWVAKRVVATICVIFTASIFV